MPGEDFHLPVGVRLKAHAGAPVARLARYAARWGNEYKILVSGRITGLIHTGHHDESLSH
jgi:hypothetical protein